MRIRLVKWMFLFVFLLIVLQTIFVHQQDDFVPTYPKVELTEESEYELIYAQTGLGKGTVNKLISKSEFQTVLDVQKAFFRDVEMECVSLLGLFTMEDRLKDKENIPLVDLQPGDIILTLSTHSLGWRHGHAGLVLDEDSVLECVSLGQDSVIVSVNRWSVYSNIAVLRVKGIDTKLQEQVVCYAKKNLLGVPYHLSSGFIGEKAPEPEKPQFGLQCAYLVWYAWNHFGYDLDSDGGRLVTAYDLLHSELLEVIQVYGLNLE